jgi:hypothetical protein
MRAWSAALQAQKKNLFVFHLRGKPRAVGRGELVLRVTDGAGRPLDANEARVAFEVAPAPRMPLLPEGAAPRMDDPHEAQRAIAAARQYSGEDWIGGWFGFDARLGDLEAFLLDVASMLASRIARDRGELQISITAAGTHPEEKKPFREGDRLADFALVTRHLSEEADVKLHVPYASIAAEGTYDGSYVRVRHQPHGTTIFDKATRASFAASGMSKRIVPLDLSFVMRRPEADGACLELARALDGIVARAAASDACIGGFVAPMGAALTDQGTPWEELAGLRDHAELDVVRRRPRSPGWRVIVPRGVKVASVAAVVQTPVAAGALLASAASSPCAMTDEHRAAVEQAIVSAFVA